MALYRVSHFNKVDNNLTGRKICINDCTLREGEQAADAAFSLDEKERIAIALDEAGVDKIQLGFPEQDAESQKAFRALIAKLKQAQTEMLIVGFSEQWKTQIDQALECGITCLNIIYRTSPYLMKLLGVTEEQAIEQSVRAVKYAKQQGKAIVIFSPTDTTRSEWDFLKRIYKETVIAGADEVNVLDTIGVAIPVAMRYLVQKVKEIVNVPIGIHTHNDFGLGLINSIAGLEGGAEIVDTCVNGMGDRAGNPALAELVLALQVLYGCSTNVNLEKLFSISQMVSDISGTPVPTNMPIVGHNVFSQKLDIHVRAALKDPLAFQPFLPNLVGNVQRIVVGKGTGPYALRAKLAELGVKEDLPEEIMTSAVKKIWQFAEQHKRCLTDEELSELIQKMTKS